MIWRALAASAVGRPINRSASGKITNTDAPTNGPHKLPAPPMITIDSTSMDSITVKLVGSI